MSASASLSNSSGLGSVIPDKRLQPTFELRVGFQLLSVSAWHKEAQKRWTRWVSEWGCVSQMYAFISVCQGRNVIDTNETFRSYFNVKGGIIGDFPRARSICCARTRWKRGFFLLWPRPRALWRGRGPRQRALLAEGETHVEKSPITPEAVARLVAFDKRLPRR